MTRLYLAGPMTGIEDHNFPAFEEAAVRLRALGYDVVSPAELTMANHATLADALTVPWAEHMKRDISAVMACDGVALMPGWTRSRGASLEHHVADELGIPTADLSWWVNPVGPEAPGDMDISLSLLDTFSVALRATQEALPRETEASTRAEFMDGAMKADSQKARVDLIPGGPLMEVGQVLGFGARKYAPNNWRKGFAWSRMQGAALRHIFAFGYGEDKDPETGLSHIAHALCCLLFLEEFIETGTGQDDRP